MNLFKEKKRGSVQEVMSEQPLAQKYTSREVPATSTMTTLSGRRKTGRECSRRKQKVAKRLADIRKSAELRKKRRAEENRRERGRRNLSCARVTEEVKNEVLESSVGNTIFLSFLRQLWSRDSVEFDICMLRVQIQTDRGK